MLRTRRPLTDQELLRYTAQTQIRDTAAAEAKLDVELGRLSRIESRIRALRRSYPLLLLRHAHTYASLGSVHADGILVGAACGLAAAAGVIVLSRVVARENPPVLGA